MIIKRGRVEMMIRSIRGGENVSGDHQTGDDRSPTVSPRVRRVPANRFPLRSPNICQRGVTMLTDAISLNTQKS